MFWKTLKEFIIKALMTPTPYDPYINPIWLDDDYTFYYPNRDCHREPPEEDDSYK